MMYVSFIFVAIFVGYSIGSSPIISFHFGAENQGELRNMFRKSTILMLVLGVAMTASALALAKPLAKLFVGYDEGLYHLTYEAFRLYSLAFLCTGLNIFASSLFTALNNGMVSAAISFARTLVFQIGAVLLLPRIIGVNGVWFATFAAELCALLVSLAFVLWGRKRYGYLG